MLDLHGQMTEHNLKSRGEFVEVFRHPQEHIAAIVMGALKADGIACEMFKEQEPDFAAFMAYSPGASVGPGIEFVVYAAVAEMDRSKRIIEATVSPESELEKSKGAREEIPLMNCPDCGTQVLAQVGSCQACGSPLTDFNSSSSSTLRALAFFALIMLLSMIIMGIWRLFF